MATQQIPATQLKPGMKYLTHYGARVVKSAGEKVIHGQRVFAWHWTPAARADGRTDCGYGGIAVAEAHAFMVEVAA